MCGREEKTRDKGEMIDEEAELVLVFRPMRRSVEGEGEKQHIGRGQQGGFRKISAGQETRDDSELKQGRQPSQKRGQRQARCRDKVAVALMPISLKLAAMMKMAAKIRRPMRIAAVVQPA